ncbi:MAG: cytochrome P450 [Actinomycetota bacterium]|nr:cytochrome P450 [Actinomycetota bacterium]
MTRYEDVLGILKDERFVKDRLNALSSEENAKTPWVPDVFKPLTRNMLDVDEPDHTRLRALVRGRIQMLCDGLLDAVQRKGSMELISDYALPVPATVIAELLGVPPEDRRKFHR